MSFGPVAAGQHLTSSDTFTLRWPIARPIDPQLLQRLLRWDITLANAAPIADAGPDQTVLRGSTVLLDGNGSSDGDGDPLTYRWEFTAKPKTPPRYCALKHNCSDPIREILRDALGWNFPRFTPTPWELDWYLLSLRQLGLVY